MTLVADYSYISSVAHCARYAYYKYERGLTSSDDESVYLVAGNALHAAIDTLYSNGWQVEGAITALRESWGDYVTPSTIRANWLTRGHCEIIVRNYADDRIADRSFTPIRLHVDDLNASAIAEYAFATDNDGYIRLIESPLAVNWSGLRYAGKIDWLGYVNGEPTLIDRKSSGQWLTETWAQSYATSHQFRGYKAIIELLTGIEISKVYVDGIYTGKEAADPIEHWRGGVSPLDGKKKTARTSVRSGLFGPYTYSPQLVDETREWAETWLAAADFFRERNHWPQNDRNCFKWGRECEYLSLCKRSPHMREAIIQQKFHARELTGILASGADSE